jgi:hypothetical protein
MYDHQTWSAFSSDEAHNLTIYYYVGLALRCKDPGLQGEPIAFKPLACPTRMKEYHPTGEQDKNLLHNLT